jgi:transaldolase
MTTTGATSPLARMAAEFGTDWWNDSCDPVELASAIERGATGATSNPSIVLEVMKHNRERWWPRVRALAAEHPSWTEVELAWATAEEVAAAGAAVLESVFRSSGGRLGRQAIQTNPANYRSANLMVEQAVHFSGLAPNIVVKFPATAAGIAAIEEAAARGVTTMSTASFTVAQAIAAAEATERGLARREAAGEDTSGATPWVVLMVGRLDDWLRVLIERDGLAVDPGAPGWAGIAVFKRAYEIFTERGYRAKLLAAATRHPLHWTELVGARAAMTLTPSWQARFERSGIEPVRRIDTPVDASILRELSTRFPDFVRAYEPDGLAIAEFDEYGATARTMRAFIGSYQELLTTVRDIVLPDPDKRPVE